MNVFCTLSCLRSRCRCLACKVFFLKNPKKKKPTKTKSLKIKRPKHPPPTPAEKLKQNRTNEIEQNKTKQKK